MSPVLIYEWITAARRWQGYALRSCFVLFLLGALVVIWNSAVLPMRFPIRAMAQLGQSFYIGLAGTQLALVMLAAPAATAGAICLDRARGTLTHLLVTDLSNSEIVLGKLVARLVPVLSLLACTLPVLELLTLLGGVDPELLWKGFVVSFGTAVLGCSLAMLLSLWVGKTHEVLLLTYAVWLLWLLSRPIFGMLSWSMGWSMTPPPQTADPFYLVLAPCWYPKSAGWSDYIWYLAVTCAVSALLIVLAIARIRAVCTRETVKKPSRALAAARNQTIWRILAKRIPWLSPSLDRNPVLWREWHRSRPSPWATAVIALYIVVSLGLSIVVVIFPAGRAAVFVNGFQVAIGLLLLSVAAATSLAEERVRGSLDLLMSTSLSTREIVFGKWCGVFRAVPLLAILPTFVIGTLAWEMGAGPWWAPAMFVYVLCAGAAVTSLGLALATRLSRLGQAVGTTVSLYVVFTVGWFFLMIMMMGGGAAGEQPAMLSPFMWAAEMTFEASERMNVPHHTGWAIIGTVAAAWFALELLASTLCSFDRRLGRMTDDPSMFFTRSTTMRILIAVYLVLAALLAISAGRNELFSLAAAFQFVVGTFLATASAASTPTAARVGRAADRGAILRALTGRIIVMKWLYALRMMLPGLILAWFMVVVWFDRVVRTYPSLWSEIPIMAGYMISTGAAAASVGLALWVRTRPGGWPVIRAIAVWSLANSGYSFFTWAVPGESLRQGLSMSSPVFGVWSLLSTITDSPAGHAETLSWAITWSVVYSLAAAGLLRVAIATQRTTDTPNSDGRTSGSVMSRTSMSELGA
jgi:ABC-type transport system involved in multi-copper enzyme maturation permease subunit